MRSTRFTLIGCLRLAVVLSLGFAACVSPTTATPAAPAGSAGTTGSAGTSGRPARPAAQGRPARPAPPAAPARPARPASPAAAGTTGTAGITGSGGTTGTAGITGRAARTARPAPPAPGGAQWSWRRHGHGGIGDRWQRRNPQAAGPDAEARPASAAPDAGGTTGQRRRDDRQRRKRATASRDRPTARTSPSSASPSSRRRSIATELETLAKAAGSLPSTEKYVNNAVSGTTIAGANGSVDQFNKAISSSGTIKYVIMDGGGNDCLQANSPTQALTGADKLFTLMTSKNVEKVLYFFYPDPIGSSFANLKTCLDQLRPMMKAKCDGLTSPKCYWLDLRPTWNGHSEYTSDGIHPTAAGSKATAAAIWPVAVANCIAQ